MNILQRIFTDYYEEMIYTLHPRSSVIENVDKMIHCGDPSFGGAMFGCPHCGKLKFVPFRCHSRFCPTCGNKYAKELCDLWCRKRTYETVTNQASRISIMRVFCRYLNDIGIPAYIPPKGITKKTDKI